MKTVDTAGQRWKDQPGGGSSQPASRNPEQYLVILWFLLLASTLFPFVVMVLFVAGFVCTHSWLQAEGHILVPQG